MEARSDDDPGVVGVGEDRLHLTAGALEPVGLAYDSASRRFVVGDGHDNKLIVADEVFNHVNDLDRRNVGRIRTAERGRDRHAPGRSLGDEQ